MKNVTIRAFVLTLAVAGLGAASVTSYARTTNKTSLQAPPQSICMPVPTCIPGQCTSGMD